VAFLFAYDPYRQPVETLIDWAVALNCGRLIKTEHAREPSFAADLRLIFQVLEIIRGSPQICRSSADKCAPECVCFCCLGKVKKKPLADVFLAKGPTAVTATTLEKYHLLPGLDGAFEYSLDDRLC